MKPFGPIEAERILAQDELFLVAFDNFVLVHRRSNGKKSERLPCAPAGARAHTAHRAGQFHAALPRTRSSVTPIAARIARASSRSSALRRLGGVRCANPPSNLPR